MIHKFPKLNDREKDAIKDWLDIEYHDRMREYHSYTACNNNEAALKMQAYAAFCKYVEMMINYHMEG